MINEQAAVGIDVSMDDFHACMKVRQADGTSTVKGSRKFSNSLKGFEELILWVGRRAATEGLVFVMEATGSYYENLAYYLYNQECQVAVVLPNKVKHFVKSLNLKTKTDKVDAIAIAQIGVERSLPRWIPMAPEYRQLRDLSREVLSLKKEKARAKCQLHAMQHGYQKPAQLVAMKQQQISFYEQNIEVLEQEIRQVVGSNPSLSERISRLEQVNGLALMTIVSVLCETNGFHLFSSMRQVVSYAGLDVEIKQSGRYTGKSKISKKGNARIRQCLFMPALSALQHNEPMRKLYERIKERNPSIKNKGVVAVMRKLLLIIFVLWKKEEPYDPHYQWS